MSEFASAVMIRVLAQGMRELGLDPGPKAPTGADARVDLSLKRTLVASAVEQGGLACLPLLGRGVHRLAHEPTHDALASANGALNLFERWQRLERYIHSQHRCELLDSDDQRARLRHVALAGAAPPLPAEDLVVLGVLAALLEAIGLQHVEVNLGRVPVYPEPDEKRLESAAKNADTAQWEFRWTTATRHAEVRRPEPPWPAELGADKDWPAVAREVYGRLMSGLTRPKSLLELAHGMQVPSRTLQRELGRSGLSYSQLLAEARCRAGAWRLLHTDGSVAEIGFLSGYADQPHFTRELQRRVGMTPAVYRDAFAVAAEDPRRHAG
ncbi:MAG: AraC family transcriptional regulator [Gemmatimonas sp.]|nr:AraC family transcriptional regulator [Gemmatimonas sp.]